MRDIDVRLVLRQHLQDRFAYDPDTRIIEELGVCQGSVRIDIAVANCSLHGYEIKSESDTLQRLPVQSEAYSRVFDHVTVVTGACHLDSTLQIIPAWWGVVQAIENGSAIDLEPFREPSSNPEIDSYAVAQLLWKEEALAILEQIGEARGLKSKAREHAWKRLSEVMPPGDLRARVRSQLKSRQGWRSDPPQM